MTLIVKKERDYSIPARVYFTILLQYAMAEGLRFFTTEEMLKVKARYENFAALKN